MMIAVRILILQDIQYIEMHCKAIFRISTGQALPVSTTSASRSQVQQLRDTTSIGIVNGELSYH